MPVELHPSLPVQREIFHALRDVLQDLADGGFVEGIEPRPRMSPPQGFFFEIQNMAAMARLERALNPCRLKCDHPSFNNIGVTSPYGDRHIFMLLRAMREIHSGLSAVLAHWQMEQYWGHTGCSFVSRGVISCGLSPEHVRFEEPEGGYLPVPRRVFDALTVAGEELGTCIRAVEELNQREGSVTRPQPRKVQRDKKTEARDKWIYQQCCKKTAYAAISRALKTEHPEWDHIESETGILAAARRYALRHRKPPPPPRLEQG